jgi:hypothetical protein
MEKVDEGGEDPHWTVVPSEEERKSRSRRRSRSRSRSGRRRNREGGEVAGGEELDVRGGEEFLKI